MKKIVLYLLAALIMFSAACGGKSSENTGVDTRSTVEESSSVEESSVEGASFEETSSSEDSSDEVFEILPEGSIMNEGACGEEASWNLYEDGTLVISGTGKIQEYAFNRYAETYDDGFYDTIRRVLVEDGITAIGAAAFSSLYTLEEAYIGETVTSIGTSAFSACSALEQIYLPGNATYLGASAFSECRNLREVVLPSGLTEISEKLFYQCNALQSVDIPDGITRVGTQAFYYCNSLQTLILPEGVTVIGAQALENCHALESIYLPSSICFIGKWAFYTADTVFSKSNSLTALYYGGTEEQWNEILAGGSYREPLYDINDSLIEAGGYAENDSGERICDLDDWEWALFYRTNYGIPEIHYNAS